MRLRESDFLYFCFYNNVKKKKKKVSWEELIAKGGSKTEVSDYTYNIWTYLGFFLAFFVTLNRSKGSTTKAKLFLNSQFLAFLNHSKLSQVITLNTIYIFFLSFFFSISWSIKCCCGVPKKYHALYDKLISKFDVKFFQSFNFQASALTKQLTTYCSDYTFDNKITSDFCPKRLLASLATMIDVLPISLKRSLYIPYCTWIRCCCLLNLTWCEHNTF